GRADGDVRLGPFGADPAVHLRTLIRKEVEVLPRMERRERVRARGDRLRLVRRRLPALRRLPGDDAAEVSVERQLVHDLQTGGLRPHDDVAAIPGEVHLQRLCARTEAERLSEVLVTQREATVD